MTLSKFWNYFSFGALILSGLTFALLLLSEYSYWLMRCFFAVARSITTPLVMLSPIVIAVTALSSLAKGLRWKALATWKILLWLSILAFSGFSFLGAFLAKYEITTSARFNHKTYYLIKFSSIDSYKYQLYSCESLGLLCRRSSGYIGIPYQNRPIRLRYNVNTRSVYIQNADQTIQIPY
jgi:hypothetical protein